MTPAVQTNRRGTVHTFQTPGPTTLVVRTGSGHVTVTAADTDVTTVELTPLNSAGEEAVAQARIEQRRSSVVVDVPRHRTGLLRQNPAVAIEVTCPTGTHLEVKADASEVRATGTFGDSLLTTGSGDIDVETVAGTAKLKTGSGSVSAGQVDETVLISTGSGDVHLHRSGRSATLTAGSGDISVGELAGEVVVKTGSGDIEVGRLAGALTTKTGSGSLTVRRASTGTVRANGASGGISIGVEEGTAAWLDLSTVSGRVDQELGDARAPDPDQHTVEITGHTVSGNLRVHRS
jgi:DUF4097 and DUF4098 domain-containing protein YvlB